MPARGNAASVGRLAPATAVQYFPPSELRGWGKGSADLPKAIHSEVPYYYTHERRICQTIYFCTEIPPEGLRSVKKKGIL